MARRKSRVNEETLSASTLHPAAAQSDDDPRTRFEILTSMIGKMHTMRDEHLTDLYYRTLELAGHEGDAVGDPSEHNKDTHNMKPSDAVASGPTYRGTEDPMPRLAGNGNPIEDVGSELDLGRTRPEQRMPMPKISVKEELDAVFEGQELSEEFKGRAVTLFETAVNARVILEAERIEEEFNRILDENVQAIHEDIEKRLDAYLDYTIDQWLVENQVALDSGIRAQLMEELFESMRAVFLEHNVNIPEEKIEVVEALGARIDEMQAQMNELINQNTEMRDAIVEHTIEQTIEEVAEGLSPYGRDKFLKLAEAVEFNGNFEEFSNKLMIVREGYVEKKAPGRTNLEEETFEGDTGKRMPMTEVDNYVNALDRTLRR